MSRTDELQYWDRTGKLIPFDDWATRFEDVEYKRVRWSRLWGRDAEMVKVSTVWLGMDHSFGTSTHPLIFETLVFGGLMNDHMARYSTEHQAIVGHELTLLRVCRAEGVDYDMARVKLTRPKAKQV